jgi:hypothetical protein
MTREGDDEGGGATVRCNVLTLFLTRCIIWAIPVCIPAQRGARSRGVADVGRGAVLPQAAHACWREADPGLTAQEVRLKRTACEAPSGSSPSPSNRAGLPRAPPSIILTAQGSHALDLRVLAL